MSSIKHNLPLDLLELYKHPAINHISGFYELAKQIDHQELTNAYYRARESAPHRHARKKRYFVGHSGVTSSGGYSNRREEHLAIALWNSTQERKPLVLPEGHTLELLDYQFPLKAQRGDKGVGKVDLFGVIDGVQSCVIELKIHPEGMGYGDTPLRAYLEALAYCAIIEANINDITQEVFENFGQRLTGNRPTLVVMAPEEYWSAYLNHERAGEWWPVLRHLADQIAQSLGLKSHFIALRNSCFNMGLNGQKPLLTGDCSLVDLADYVQGTNRHVKQINNGK